VAFTPNYQLLFQDTAISGSSSILTHFQAHNNAIFDVAWLPGSRSQVVTVSGDQSAKLWDFENATTAAVVQELRVFRFLFCFFKFKYTRNSKFSVTQSRMTFNNPHF
jgi:WD40 repeat protein